MWGSTFQHFSSLGDGGIRTHGCSLGGLRLRGMREVARPPSCPQQRRREPWAAQRDRVAQWPQAWKHRTKPSPPIPCQTLRTSRGGTPQDGEVAGNRQSEGRSFRFSEGLCRYRKRLHETQEQRSGRGEQRQPARTPRVPRRSSGGVVGGASGRSCDWSSPHLEQERRRAPARDAPGRGSALSP